MTEEGVERDFDIVLVQRERPNLLLKRFIDRVSQAALTKFEGGQERYGDSWHDAPPSYFWDRMEEEMYEFRQAVFHDRDYVKGIGELADIVNFGLMMLIRTYELENRHD